MNSTTILKGGKFTGDQKVIKLHEKVTLDDIVLEDTVRSKLLKEVFGFFAMEDLYKKVGLPFKRGVMLYGVPGGGKTMVAKIIASTSPQTLIWVRAGDMGEVEDINRVFRLARMAAPSILFLEDVDFYLHDRDSPKGDGVAVSNIMAQLDGLEENNGIMVIMTTNRLESIEKAISERRGRIDTQIFFGELGKDKIIELLKKKLHSFATSFDDWENVIKQGTLLSGAEVVELSTLILRNGISESENPASFVISEAAVKNAVKDMERSKNRKVAGFGNE